MRIQGMALAMPRRVRLDKRCTFHEAPIMLEESRSAWRFACSALSDAGLQALGVALLRQLEAQERGQGTLVNRLADEATEAPTELQQFFQMVQMDLSKRWRLDQLELSELSDFEEEWAAKAAQAWDAVKACGRWENPDDYEFRRAGA